MFDGTLNFIMEIPYSVIQCRVNSVVGVCTGFEIIHNPPLFSFPRDIRLRYTCAGRCGPQICEWNGNIPYYWSSMRGNPPLTLWIPFNKGMVVVYYLLLVVLWRWGWERSVVALFNIKKYASIGRRCCFADINFSNRKILLAKSIPETAHLTL